MRTIISTLLVLLSINANADSLDDLRNASVADWEVKFVEIFTTEQTAACQVEMDETSNVDRVDALKFCYCIATSYAEASYHAVSKPAHFRGARGPEDVFHDMIRWVSHKGTPPQCQNLIPQSRTLSSKS